MLVYHPDYARHIASPGHVESPQRLEAIVQKLESLRMMDDYVVPQPATRDAVQGTHTKAYVDLLEALGEGYLDVDTPIHVGTIEYALLAAGGVLAAARGSAESGRPSLALIRPPGHHAGPDYGGGFCYLNNVAIAANHLRREFGRVAILDFDAHHGNGTCDIFAGSRDVLYISTHQWGIFPGTGPAEYVGDPGAEGFTVHIPFPGRSGDASFDLAFREVIEPIVRQFRPEALLVSLGGDAHYMDPLTGLVLTTPGYLQLMEATLKLGATHAHGRVTIALEGGYHLPALAEVVAGTYALFRGESIHAQFTEMQDERGRGRDVVHRVKEIQAAYWDL